VKLVNQLLCGAHIAAAAEALAYAEAIGLDPEDTWEVVRGGAAASFMLDDRGDRMVHPSDEVRSALDIFVKDMGLVLDTARASSHPAPLAAAAEQLYLAGRRAGLGRRDDSSVIEVLRGVSAEPGRHQENPERRTLRRAGADNRRYGIGWTSRVDQVRYPPVARRL
jgi:3-hydroxyisobutyrate dehydrogenase